MHYLSSLVTSLLQNLGDLTDGVLHDVLCLVAMLRRNVLQLGELRHDLVAAGDLVQVLVETTEARVLDLVCRALDVALEITGVAVLNGLLDALEELLGITTLERISVLLNKLLDLGVLVEVGLGLLHALVPSLVTELLELVDLLLHDALDLLNVRGADASLDDVTDLLPCPVDLLLGLGAVLVTILLELVPVATDLLLQLWMVVHDLLCRVASEVGDAAHVFGEDVPGLVCGDQADVAVTEDGAHLAVSFADDAVDFIAVFLADGIEIIEGRVDVALRARDEGSVALSGIPCNQLRRLLLRQKRRQWLHESQRQSCQRWHQILWSQIEPVVRGTEASLSSWLGGQRCEPQSGHSELLVLKALW
ncbi:hypothetical protein HBI65_155010 [Parastagonospora nodorum]|nr:hypothetical protein HBH52_202000 [Parastagonospora nodorum]KAH5395212.1 hypothetical protein HBI47_233230 [Parastagonospora nodorum]KAH6091563.1 hypothetical protein HBI65_155010 [Parastagonospora nodorum]